MSPTGEGDGVAPARGEGTPHTSEAPPAAARQKPATKRKKAAPKARTPKVRTVKAWLYILIFELWMVNV